MTEPDTLLLREDRDHVAWLTMNRPAARNALSVALMGAMEAALERPWRKTRRCMPW